jgi:hypothetical protein
MSQRFLTARDEPVLSVSDLRKEFRIRSRGVAKTLTAVDGVPARPWRSSAKAAPENRRWRGA